AGQLVHPARVSSGIPGRDIASQRVSGQGYGVQVQFVHKPFKGIECVFFVEILQFCWPSGQPEPRHVQSNHTMSSGKLSNPFVPGLQGRKNRSEEHTSELQSRENLVCRLLLEKKKKKKHSSIAH